MSVVFLAVADPTRRQLLDRLRSSGPLSIRDLTSGLGVTRQAVTKHLDALRRAGLVVARRSGRERLHELNASPLKQVDDWLAPYSATWDRRLDALQAHLEETDQ